MDLNPGEQAVIASRGIDSQPDHSLEFFEDDRMSDPWSKTVNRDIAIPELAQQMSLENALLYVIRIGRQLGETYSRVHVETLITRRRHGRPSGDLDGNRRRIPREAQLQYVAGHSHTYRSEAAFITIGCMLLGGQVNPPFLF